MEGVRNASVVAQPKGVITQTALEIQNALDAREEEKAMTKCPRCSSPLERHTKVSENDKALLITLLCGVCLYRSSTALPNPLYKPIIVEPSKDQKHRQKPYA